MTSLGPSVAVRGEVRASEDVTIEGRVDGPVYCEQGAVIVAASGHVSGDIVARDITVFGTTTGQLVGVDIVDVRASAVVRGTIVSGRFVLDPEAEFAGRVEPQHLEAALRVARFTQRQRDSAAGH